MNHISNRQAWSGASTLAADLAIAGRNGTKPAARTEAAAGEEIDGNPAILIQHNGGTHLRWQHGERLNHVIEASCDVHGPREAILADGEVLTYRELDQRANQLARYLIAQGIKPGDRVGLLFDKTAETYIALLAVLKANAAYVPLDGAFPKGRLDFISGDAALSAVLSMSSLGSKLDGVAVKALFLDAVAAEIATFESICLSAEEAGIAPDETAYIIYTSGTTGNPKGVIIEHASICNFIRVASELYGYEPGDRVYQGMTIAFDFSVEEIWVPLIAGATLVPGQRGRNLVGDELGHFLHDSKVTCLACCPTLLLTIERQLPHIRILLLGGEACPQNLVERWQRPGRTILNSYGPTEATVTAMLTELRPGKPVTIGEPLPTYSIVILDAAENKVVQSGELGEIGIAGIGLAKGYLNNDDLTARKFIPDHLGLPANPSRRIYRTGDLGRLNADGEVEYLGRIDSQVKIRGYRIELSEIEAVLMEFPQIAQAAVSTHESDPGMLELVAYFVRTSDGGSLDKSDIDAALRKKLPSYMVPAYLEELTALPMSVSNKTDYKKLPPPAGPRFFAGSKTAAAKPETDAERAMCSALAEILKYDAISVEDDFFQDLGANSLLMARFCTKVRSIPSLGHISMQDIYLHPRIRDLALHLEKRATDGRAVLQQAPDPLHIPSDLAYWGCGVAQLAFLGGYALFALWLAVTGYYWVQEAHADTLAFLARSTAMTAGMLLALTMIPIAAKWLLIGKWRAESFPIWSFRYFRFWMVKTLVRSSPANLFAGTPVYNVYLRLLGAKIGRNAVILSRYVPVCTDMFSVGDNTILHKDTVLLGYRAQANFIHTGPISIGNNAFVGSASVLDINTRMGDRTQLGQASSLQSGQSIPDDTRYHGSPAVATSADYCPIQDLPDSGIRRGLYSAGALAAHIIVTGPGLILAILLFAGAMQANETGSAAAAHIFSAEILATLAASAAGVFFGGLLLGLAVVWAIPRLCQMFLEEGKVYPLYGFHYLLQRIIFFTSNSRLYTLLFGDTSYIVHYMQAIGWKLGRVEQTGSNFGTNQRHDNPFLCQIGSGTMCSDGISMINLHMSSSSFCLKASKVGDHNYLGNDIQVPPESRAGSNCLLGTKVLVPIDGPMRENVGLLGSPSFEIPRMVERDRDMIATLGESTRRQRLRDKNRHNLATIAMFLATRWLFVFATLFAAHVAIATCNQLGLFAPLLASIALGGLAIGYFALIERASLGFGSLKPSMITIYDPDFWHHERHWKLSDSMIVGFLVGTPFRNMISRLLGVKVGKKVYDGGAVITERTLTEIGDYATLNEACVLQAHSLEEGAFKSDTIVIGNGCTVGPAAFVHYGVRMGEQSVLDADSFLMKGETLAPGSGWRGNPAKLHRSPAAKPRSVEGVGVKQLVARPVAKHHDDSKTSQRPVTDIAAREIAGGATA
jgi:non-ribosomal peptide synthetase-like protein